jgi:DNA-directed RNA polymerase I, II, and III subunit RPABC2
MYNDDYESDSDTTVNSNIPDVESDEDDLSIKDNDSLLSDEMDDVIDNLEEEETKIIDRADNDDDTVMSDIGTDITHLFDPQNINAYISTSHPECLPISYEELQCMLPVVRNAHGIIIDDFHKTLPILTKYEKTRVLGQRASMIEAGAKVFVDVPPNIIDSIVIAEMELTAKKIPFIIKRPIPNNGFEYWRLVDLEQL